MSILTGPTMLSLWQKVVHSAEKACATNLKEDLESYLVFLLMRYTDKPAAITNPVALRLLSGMQASAPASKKNALQSVGDSCLLVAGLFPFIAEKRLVKVSYFVGMGQAAYGAISKHRNDLYELLAKQFVQLMEVLQAIRHYTVKYPDLQPLQAYELWNDTGSQRALTVLQGHTQALPLQSHRWKPC